MLKLSYALLLKPDSDDQCRQENLRNILSKLSYAELFRKMFFCSLKYQLENYKVVIYFGINFFVFPALCIKTSDVNEYP